MRLSNSHSQKLVEPRRKIQSLDFGKKQYNISPNQPMSTYLKLKQVPPVKGFCFLKNVHFRGIYLELFILSYFLASVFCFTFKRRKLKWTFSNFTQIYLSPSWIDSPNPLPGLLLVSNSSPSSSMRLSYFGSLHWALYFMKLYYSVVDFSLIVSCVLNFAPQANLITHKLIILQKLGLYVVFVIPHRGNFLKILCEY